MRYCVLLFCLSCWCFLPAPLRAAPPPEPFTVTIKTAATRVALGEAFSVELRVVNTSDTVQEIQTMSCSWDENWQSSNAHVLCQGWPCKRNGTQVLQLKPGEVYAKTLPMLVHATTPSIHKISFKMGFTPRLGQRDKPVYWSNEISLRL